MAAGPGGRERRGTLLLNVGERLLVPGVARLTRLVVILGQGCIGLVIARVGSQGGWAELPRWQPAPIAHFVAASGN